MTRLDWDKIEFDFELCCHTCSPAQVIWYLLDNKLVPAGEIAWAEREGPTVDVALDRMGWVNPFIPGTAQLKEVANCGGN